MGKPETGETVPQQVGPVILRTRALSKRFGEHVAVDGLDLELRAGEVHGFLGPNGSGKSTTVGMILGLLRPSAGEVELFGRRLAEGGHAANLLLTSAW